MLDPITQERLLEEFRVCLSSGAASTEDDDEAVDLHTLLAEMAMLKNEIRLESRQFKSMLEEMRTFGDALREQNERLTREIERAREHTTDVRQKAERGLLLEMLDLRDRLQAGVHAGATRQPSFLSRLMPGETRYVLSIAQGLTLTLQRLDDVLAGYRVHPVHAIGQALDPHRMRVVSVESHTQIPDGQVLHETRRGFLHDGALLRAAEVIVNKRVQEL